MSTAVPRPFTIIQGGKSEEPELPSLPIYLRSNPFVVRERLGLRGRGMLYDPAEIFNAEDFTLTGPFRGMLKLAKPRRLTWTRYALCDLSRPADAADIDAFVPRGGTVLSSTLAELSLILEQEPALFFRLCVPTVFVLDEYLVLFRYIGRKPHLDIADKHAVTLRSPTRICYRLPLTP